MSKQPLTISDFQKGWKMVLEKEDENKQFPIHKLGGFRIFQSGRFYCKLCRRSREDYNDFFYSKLCFGKRRWWIGRRLCPSTPHFHVRCTICQASWLESQEYESP